jgi:glutathione S-transferase
MYRLISATPSPYARKVRIALTEKGIPFELVTEVPWDSDTSTPQYNPLEKLPVLICDDWNERLRVPLHSRVDRAETPRASPHA